MPTIGARLKHDGTLVTAGELDEYTNETHSITATTIFANELDEITLGQFLGSGGSVLMNGTNQKLALSGSGDFQFGTGDFTVEGWFYLKTVGGNIPYTRLWCFPNGDNVEVHNTSVYYWNGGETVTTSGSNTIRSFAWFHAALVKYNGTAKVYINGIEKITDSTPYNSAASRPLTIGGESVGADVTGEAAVSGADGWLNGYVTNFRVVKGTAVYTSNFSISYEPLTAVTNTTLLLNMASSATMLTDSSGTSKSVTNVGGAQFDMTTPLSVAYNGVMKQLKTGTLQVTNEFDEYNGGSSTIA